MNKELITYILTCPTGELLGVRRFVKDELLLRRKLRKNPPLSVEEWSLYINGDKVGVIKSYKDRLSVPLSVANEVYNIYHQFYEARPNES